MSAWGRERDAAAVVRAGPDAGGATVDAGGSAAVGDVFSSAGPGPAAEVRVEGPSPGGPARWYPAVVWARALGVYGVVLAVLLVVSWQVVARYTEHAPGVPPVEVSGRWFWDGWVRYDAGWYTLIADAGYSYREGQQSSVAFFPGYPTMVRAVSGVVGNTPLAGILVTIACGAAALVVYHGWCRSRLAPQAAWAALLCLAVYPYAFYLYGAVYAEALFLLCALVAFAAFERDHLVVAGLAGAAASATRLVGLAVALGLVVGVAERRGLVRGTSGWRWRDRLDLSVVRRRDAWVLVAFVGFAAWAVFLWHRYGDPMLFSRVQEAWGQGSGPHTWLKRDFLASVAGIRGDRLFAYGLWAHAAVGLAVVLSVPAVAQRFGLRYGVYVAIVAGIPLLGSQDFHAMGRYVLVAFPTFALVGALLADRPVLRRVVLALSAAALVALTVGFANGRYVS